MEGTIEDQTMAKSRMELPDRGNELIGGRHIQGPDQGQDETDLNDENPEMRNR